MRMLVTAGPTREFFDSVRFISNPSSGKMGYAIAAELARRGHHVTLISGPVELAAPEGVELVSVISAEEMFEAATSAFVECHAAVMTAAVCDYRPQRRLGHKLKKQNRALSIQLEPTRDICAHLGQLKGDRCLVGFAMEDHDHHRNAVSKLERKRCDAMILNTIDNVAGDRAEIQILRADTGWDTPIAGTKSELAVVLADLVDDLLSRTH